MLRPGTGHPAATMRQTGKLSNGRARLSRAMNKSELRTAGRHTKIYGLCGSGTVNNLSGRYDERKIINTIRMMIKNDDKSDNPDKEINYENKC